MYGSGCVKIDTPQTYNWTPLHLYVWAVYFGTPQTLVDGPTFGIHKFRPENGKIIMEFCHAVFFELPSRR